MIAHCVLYAGRPCDFWVRIDSIQGGSYYTDEIQPLGFGRLPELVDFEDILLEERSDGDVFTLYADDNVPDEIWAKLMAAALGA